MVAANVVAVNSAINAAVAAANQTTFATCDTACRTIVANVATEVSALSKASATISNVFTTQFLMGFGQGIGSYTNDSVGAGEIIANLVTADSAGDTIRAVMAETTNSTIISGKNDPNPRMAVYQAQAQNIPLSTYISQNK